jgi:hypothetical protein
MENRFVACTGPNSDWVAYRSCQPKGELEQASFFGSGKRLGHYLSEKLTGV